MPFIRLLSLPVGERGVASIPPPPSPTGRSNKIYGLKISNFFNYFKFHTSET